jgi:hypothetical protein
MNKPPFSFSYFVVTNWSKNVRMIVPTSSSTLTVCHTATIGSVMQVRVVGAMFSISTCVDML